MGSSADPARILGGAASLGQVWQRLKKNSAPVGVVLKCSSSCWWRQCAPPPLWAPAAFTFLRSAVAVQGLDPRFVGGTAGYRGPQPVTASAPTAQLERTTPRPHEMRSPQEVVDLERAVLAQLLWQICHIYSPHEVAKPGQGASAINLGIGPLYRRVSPAEIGR
jgi:hypothetical protein